MDDAARRGSDDLGRLYDALDLIGDLDDVGAGGSVGAGATLDLASDALFRGPDDTLDALEGAADVADVADTLGDVF